MATRPRGFALRISSLGRYTTAPSRRRSTPADGQHQCKSGCDSPGSDVYSTGACYISHLPPPPVGRTRPRELQVREADAPSSFAAACLPWDTRLLSGLFCASQGCASFPPVCFLFLSTVIIPTDRVVARVASLAPPPPRFFGYLPPGYQYQCF